MASMAPHHFQIYFVNAVRIALEQHVLVICEHHMGQIANFYTGAKNFRFDVDSGINFAAVELKHPV